MSVGYREETLTALAGECRAKGLGIVKAAARLRQMNAGFDVSMENADVNRILNSVYFGSKPRPAKTPPFPPARNRPARVRKTVSVDLMFRAAATAVSDLRSALDIFRPWLDGIPDDATVSLYNGRLEVAWGANVYWDTCESSA